MQSSFFLLLHSRPEKELINIVVLQRFFFNVTVADFKKTITFFLDSAYVVQD